MNRLKQLLPFLTLFMVFVLLLLMAAKSFASSHSEPNRICTFKLNTNKTGHLKKLIPAGTYRLIGKRTNKGARFASVNFQKLEFTKFGKHWKTLGKTEGGKRLTVNLKNNRDNLFLYFNESKSQKGSCVLEGSLHGWS
jgi:hypothetical protein